MDAMWDRGNPYPAVHPGRCNGLCHGGEAEPVDHHGDLSGGKRKAQANRVHLSAAGVNGFAVLKQMTIERQPFRGRCMVAAQASGGVDQISAARPEL